MKIEGILWCGVALMAAVVISSLAMAGERAAAGEDSEDWASQSPLAFGEPMEDCDQHHPALIAIDVPASGILPAQELEPEKPAPLNPATGKTTRKPLSPNSLTPGALFTFALIASPGGQLPVTAK